MSLAGSNSAVSADGVRQQVDRILQTDPFARSDRHSRLLRYIVERTLMGRAEDLKEYTLAQEVWDRKDSFDPRIDPIVRVEAGRFRAKLQEYYQGPGLSDPVIIELPKGAYVPTFRMRQSQASGPARSVQADVLARWAWLGGVALAIVVAVVLVLRSARRGPPSGAPAAETTIAVLPFVDLSPGRDHEYLSDGVTEELTDALTHIRGVRVVARTSAFRFKGKNDDVRRIGRELNARMLVEGSVRAEGSKLKITAQLIDGQNGYHLWSSQYERRAEEVFAVQQEIAGAVAGALERRLVPAHLSKARWPTGRSVEARTVYLQGAHLARKWTETDLHRALELYRQAIAVDAEYAPAHAGMADAYALLGVHGGLHPRQAMTQAKAAAQRALSLDSSLARSHAALATVLAVFEWDWSGAHQEFKRAIELDPADTEVLEEYIMAYLLPQGLFDEAVAVSERGLTLDPVSHRMHSVAGMTRLYRREYDQGIAAVRRSIELDSTFLPAHIALGSMYAQKGMYAEAIASFEKGKSAWVGGMGQALLGYAMASMGRREDARRALRALEELATERYVSKAYAAFLHLRLGETERALDALEQAFEQRSASLIYLKVNPRYDVLRSQPRYIRLLKRLGLE